MAIIVNDRFFEVVHAIFVVWIDQGNVAAFFNDGLLGPIFWVVYVIHGIFEYNRYGLLRWRVLVVELLNGYVGKAPDGTKEEARFVRRLLILGCVTRRRGCTTAVVPFVATRHRSIHIFGTTCMDRIGCFSLLLLAATSSSFGSCLSTCTYICTYFLARVAFFDSSRDRMAKARGREQQQDRGRYCYETKRRGYHHGIGCWRSTF
mmetsp:Transcript_2278/g.5219  ORF Transcript_2278/g.5219 Transcript_2278/m.5219 type:complete len:205 (-) Transcript_2278:190-804(-)